MLKHAINGHLVNPRLLDELGNSPLVPPSLERFEHAKGRIQRPQHLGFIAILPQQPLIPYVATELLQSKLAELEARVKDRSAEAVFSGFPRLLIRDLHRPTRCSKDLDTTFRPTYTL